MDVVGLKLAETFTSYLTLHPLNIMRIIMTFIKFYLFKIVFKLSTKPWLMSEMGFSTRSNIITMEIVDILIRSLCELSNVLFRISACVNIVMFLSLFIFKMSFLYFCHWIFRFYVPIYSKLNVNYILVCFYLIIFLFLYIDIEDQDYIWLQQTETFSKFYFE